MSGAIFEFWRRQGGRLAVAVFLTWVLTRWVPVVDPFFSTLFLLPGWVWLLGFSLRGVPGAARALGPHALTLGLWLLTLPARDLLSWAHVDALWAALLWLLLGCAWWRLMPFLLRRLGADARLVRRPGLVFFWLPLLAHLAALPWALEHRAPDGDEPYYLLLGHSVAFDGDVDLSNNYRDEHWRAFMDRPIEPQPGDPVGSKGEVYSRHNALLPLVTAPLYRLAGRWGVAVAMAVMSAAVCWLMLAVARRRWPKMAAGSLWSWGILAFASPLWIYSHQIWVEVPAALLLMLAMDRIAAMRPRPAGSAQDPAPPFRQALILGCILVLLPLLKLRFLLVAAPLALWAVLSTRRPGQGLPRRALRAAVGLALAVVAVLAFNAWRYGNPLKMYRAEELNLFLPLSDYARGAVGMFYDSSFGLFGAAPIWLLLLPALWLLWRRRDPLAWQLPLLAAPYLLAVAPRLEWYGGWSPPFRYPLVFLPLLALALTPLLQRRTPGVRLLLWCLGPLTAVMVLIYLVTPAWAYHLADGEGHFLHRLGWILQSDLGRMFPSAIRPGTATWLWPLLTLLLIPMAAWRARAAARRRLPALGMALLLGLVAGVPWLARALPTTEVHWEDGWITRDSGELLPPRWTPARPSQVGAWLVPTRGGLSAPVVAGGDRVRLRLWVRRDNLGPRTIRVAAGDRELAVVTMKRLFMWEQIEVGPVAWPAGEPLVLSIPHGPKRKPGAGIMFDRTELEWL